MIKYYLYLDNIRLIKRPVMRAAAENRRRKRVHAHIFVSPGLYGDAQICVTRPLWVKKSMNQTCVNTFHCELSDDKIDVEIILHTLKLRHSTMHF